MDSDDDNEELNTTDPFLQDSISEHKAFFERFRRFIPEQIILYIHYYLLRIPLLLLYDYLFTEDFYSLIQSFLKYSIDIIDKKNHIFFKPISYILHSYALQLLISINVVLLIPIVGLILLTILLLCSDRHLLIVYSHAGSFIAFYFYYQINHLHDIQLNIFIFQCILSITFLRMLVRRSHVYTHTIQKCLCYLAPFLYLLTRYCFSLKFSINFLNLYYFLWIIIHLSELIIYERNAITNSIRFGLLHELYNLFENFGIQTLFNYLQQHIQIVTLLKFFWLIKVFVLPLSIRTIYTSPFLTKNETDIINYNETITKTIYFTILFYGTETIFTLISFSCLVSFGMKIISHRLFRLLNIWTEDAEHIGTIMGVMLFLLLFQLNLTRLDLNRRHIPLLKAFSLLIVALFHFLHTALEPQLLKVAMQTMTNNMAFQQMDENKSTSYFSRKILCSFYHRHVYTCLSMLFLLIFYLILLWRITTFSTWLLAMTGFLLELIVRLLASLAQYTLYVLDAYNCLSNVDSFDEHIFLIKAITSIFEFILGVFLLFNGFYILCFEASGALRAFMLAIHAHLNIIKNLRRGWQIFRNRRLAWDNVNQLPLATEEQIQNYNDICSICHNILTIGKTCITPCSHLFHQKCLQKAFYATQNCALCSRPIIVEKNLHQ